MILHDPSIESWCWRNFPWILYAQCIPGVFFPSDVHQHSTPWGPDGEAKSLRPVDFAPWSPKTEDLCLCWHMIDIYIYIYIYIYTYRVNGMLVYGASPPIIYQSLLEYKHLTGSKIYASGIYQVYPSYTYPRRLLFMSYSTRSSTYIQRNESMSDAQVIRRVPIPHVKVT